MNDIPMSLNFTLCLELVSKRYQLKTLNSFHKFKLKSSDFFLSFLLPIESIPIGVVS